MKRKSGNFSGDIPYDPQTGTVPTASYGNTLNVYDPVTRSYKQIPIVTKKNHVFQDVLSKFAFHRGQHSVNVSADSAHPDRKHTIFLADFEEMVPFLEDGKINGMFTYTKRGTKYATKLDPDYVRVFFERKKVP